MAVETPRMTPRWWRRRGASGGARREDGVGSHGASRGWAWRGLVCRWFSLVARREDRRAEAVAEVKAVVARADGNGAGVGDNVEVRRRRAGKEMTDRQRHTDEGRRVAPRCQHEGG